MNTEAKQDQNIVNSTGERLRIARENLGLTQQHVAERLCLKLSTVRDIEEDKAPDNLAATFLRGYIRSYARLVHVPEEELLPMMARQTPARTAKVEPVQSLSLGKRRKKRDGWLMMFTWLVLFVVVGLTGAWWWQNHKEAQDEMVSLSDRNADNGRQQTVPLDNSSSLNDSGGVAPATNMPDNRPVADSQTSAALNSKNTTNTSEGNPVAGAAQQPVAPGSVLPSPSPVAPVTTPEQQGVNAAGSDVVLPAGNAAVATSADNANAVIMNFNADCWLEVTDSTGKKLFSGIQHNGGKLSLTGVAPYRLKIGAPRAVQVQYQGQPVDLSRFIRNNQVARLTLGTQ